MTNELALLVHWAVRQKLNHISSVQFSYVALYACFFLSLHSIAISVKRCDIMHVRST